MDELERILATDPGRRGVLPLVVPGDLTGAAQAVLDCHHIVIATGFFVPEAGAAETDGPPGAEAIGAAARALGKQVMYLTDPPCAPVLLGMGLEPLVVFSESLALPEADCWLAIERPGRAADGRYYSMRGADLSQHCLAIDQWFLTASRRGARTIGIGDGGNEIGMGKVAAMVKSSVPLGQRIASVISTDKLVVAGVSNWGGWGLVAEMSRRVGQQLLPTTEMAHETLVRAVAAGAVDGITGQNDLSVDGFPWMIHTEVLARLHRIATRDRPRAG